MVQRIYSRKFKAADIFPVYKGGSKKDMNNYRPISVFSNLAKIFEKIMHTRSLDFSHKHTRISDRQYGFLKEKSTDDAIAQLSTFIYDIIKCSSSYCYIS